MHAEADVLAHGQMGEKIVFLKQHRHRARSGRRMGMVLTLNGDTAIRRLQKTGHQIEERAFPCAAGAEHGNQFALAHGKGETHRQVLIKPGYISEC